MTKGTYCICHIRFVNPVDLVSYATVETNYTLGMLASLHVERDRLLRSAHWLDTKDQGPGRGRHEHQFRVRPGTRLPDSRAIAVT